jgi:hypothetical protein
MEKVFKPFYISIGYEIMRSFTFAAHNSKQIDFEISFRENEFH